MKTLKVKNRSKNFQTFLNIYRTNLLHVFSFGWLFFSLCKCVADGRFSEFSDFFLDPGRILVWIFRFLAKNQHKLSKNHPKSRQNRSQIAPKIQQKSQTRPKHDFFDFVRFLKIFESPGASQNRAKNAQIRKKTFKNLCSKKIRFSTPLFYDFSSF